MIENPPIALVFLSLFHLLGGGALGIALRGLRAAGRQGCRTNIGLAIWGLMFGGFPLALGLQIPELLAIQLAELGIACLTTFFFWERIRELLARPEVMLTLFGGILFSAGCGAAGALLMQDDWLMAALFGVLFGGAGAGMIYLGLRRALAPPADQEDE